VGTFHRVHDASGRGHGSEHAGGRLTCPFCNSYDVGRLFLASLNLDSCECVACGARWDEECGSGEYRGRSQRSSVLMPRNG
jgi:Zn ribbon nucleic-acid-binding protein